MSVGNQHIQRAYRSLSLPTNLWSIGASGGTISGGNITLLVGEDVGMAFVPPYDLDPSFPLKFRIHFQLSGSLLAKFVVYCNLRTTDGTTEGHTYDRSESIPLTTPIPDKVITAEQSGKWLATEPGSLTLPSATRRNWAASLYLVGGDNGAFAPSICSLEIAYVPLISDKLGQTAGGGRVEAWSV